MNFQQLWNALDYYDEQDNALREKQFESLLDDLSDRISGMSVKKKAKLGPFALRVSIPISQDKIVIEEFMEEKIKLPSDFKGPILTMPPTVDKIVELISYFKEGNKLPYGYVVAIIQQFIQSSLDVPNIVHIQIPENGRLTVVGDLHGQFEDLVHIFKINGLPSKENAYLFNGDYVDRGNYGIEILLILYCFKIVFPNSFFLNRGNHEQKRINERYGFEQEIRKKYDYQMFRLISTSYWFLPLASVIENQAWVAHGGISSFGDITIQEILKIDRKIDLPHGIVKKTTQNYPSTTLIEDILWSDPSEEIEEIQPNKKRGCGILWGKKHTQKFLTRNALRFIIRSHEAVDGYEFHHEGKVITLFSASYYCGSNTNHGALLNFKAEDKKELKPEFIKYHALIDTKTIVIDSNAKQQTLRKLGEIIFKKRAELEICLSRLDTDQDGLLSLEEFASGLSGVLQLPFPWIELTPFLTEIREDNKISINSFLRQYHFGLESVLSKRLQEILSAKIAKKILQHSRSLESEWKKLSKNNQGKINFYQFRSALKKYDLGISDEQMLDLMLSLDTDGTNFIDYQEFLNRFQVGFRRSDSVTDPQTVRWLFEETDKIGRSILEQKISLEAFFDHFDKKKKERIDINGFLKMLEHLDMTYSKKEAELLFNYVNRNGDKKITLREFKDAFGAVDSSSTQWINLISQISTVIIHNKVELMRAFKQLDIEDRGFISQEDFYYVLKVVNKLAGNRLTLSQIKNISQLVPSTESQQIDYMKFLDCIVIIDKNETPKDVKKILENTADRHLFFSVEVNENQTISCSVCTAQFYGMWRNAFQCSSCNLICHIRCRVKVTAPCRLPTPTSFKVMNYVTEE